jgi:hypothetical protein
VDHPVQQEIIASSGEFSYTSVVPGFFDTNDLNRDVNTAYGYPR